MWEVEALRLAAPSGEPVADSEPDMEAQKVEEGEGTREGVGAAVAVPLVVPLTVEEGVGLPVALEAALSVAKKEREAPACEGDTQGEAVSVSLGDSEADTVRVGVKGGEPVEEAVLVRVGVCVAELQTLTAAEAEAAREGVLWALAVGAPVVVGAALEALGQGLALGVGVREPPAAPPLGVLAALREPVGEGQEEGEGEREADTLTLVEAETLTV